LDLDLIPSGWVSTRKGRRTVPLRACHAVDRLVRLTTLFTDGPEEGFLDRRAVIPW
jgi:hypothetical protein